MVKSKRNDRILALKYCYSQEFGGSELSPHDFIDHFQYKPKKLFFSIAEEFNLKKNEIEDLIKPHISHWKWDRVYSIDKVLLLIALAESRVFPKKSKNIIINEYLDISKEFSTKESSKFINGILDKVI